MENEEIYGPIIGIVIVVAIIFFGGWFMLFNRPATPVETDIFPVESGEPATENSFELPPAEPAATVTPAL